MSFICCDPKDKRIFGYVRSQPCTTGHKIYVIKSEKPVSKYLDTSVNRPFNLQLAIHLVQNRLVGEQKSQWDNRPFLSSKKSHFQNEAKCETFVVKMSCICIIIKTHFHNKGFALILASLWKWDSLELGNGLLKTNKRLHTLINLNGNFLCLSCPSATFALQHGGFVPCKWLAATGVFLCGFFLHCTIKN